MARQASTQKRTACRTCPFLKDMKAAFERDRLEETVVSNLDKEYIHPCHTTPRYMCTGYLAFAHFKLEAEGGLASLMLGRMGIGLRLIDPDKIPNLDIFGTTEEMLEAHDRHHYDQTFSQ